MMTAETDGTVVLDLKKGDEVIICKAGTTPILSPPDMWAIKRMGYLPTGMSKQ